MKNYIKNIVSAAVCLSVMCSSVTLTPANADTYGDWRVSNKTGGWELRSYVGSNSVVVMPETVNGRPVVGYSYDMFKDSPVVKDVTLNNTVTKTIRDMFRDAPNLEKITFGATAYASIEKINTNYVKNIDFSKITADYTLSSDCLDPCESLEEINFGDHVYLSENLSYLPNLKKITLGTYNKMAQVNKYTIMSSDGKRVLMHCTSEDKDYFGLSATSYVDIMKFYNADAILLAEGITAIPKGYLTGTNLKAMVIPTSVTSLPEYSIGYDKYELSIGWDYKKRENFEIYSEIGATAQQYALQCNFKYYPTVSVADTVYERFTRKECTSADALKVLQQVVGLTQENGNLVGVGDDLDVDRDGYITSEDALKILQQVVGLEVGIPEFYGFDPEILKTPIIDGSNINEYVNNYRPIQEEPENVNTDITEQPMTGEFTTSVTKETSVTISDTTSTTAVTEIDVTSVPIITEELPESTTYFKEDAEPVNSDTIA